LVQAQNLGDRERTVALGRGQPFDAADLLVDRVAGGGEASCTRVTWVLVSVRTSSSAFLNWASASCSFVFKPSAASLNIARTLRRICATDSFWWRRTHVIAHGAQKTEFDFSRVLFDPLQSLDDFFPHFIGD
jgi:hypothetical protein